MFSKKKCFVDERISKTPFSLFVSEGAFELLLEPTFAFSLLSERDPFSREFLRDRPGCVGCDLRDSLFCLDLAFLLRRVFSAPPTRVAELVSL